MSLGVTTFSIMMLTTTSPNIMMFSIVTLNKKLNKMKLDITKLIIIMLVIMKLIIMAFSIMTLGKMAL